MTGASEARSTPGPRSRRWPRSPGCGWGAGLPATAEIADLRKRLDQVCEAEDRDPSSLPLSMMTGWLVGTDREELRDRAARLAQWKGQGDDGDAFLADLRKGTIAGTALEALEQLRELEQAGLTRLMAQHLLHRDLDAIELIGQEVIPALAR